MCLTPVAEWQGCIRLLFSSPVAAQNETHALQVGPCSRGEGVHQGRPGGLVWAQAGGLLKPLVPSGAHRTYLPGEPYEATIIFNAHTLRVQVGVYNVRAS